MSKWQKRGSALVIVVCMIFALSACGRSGEISYDSTDTSAVPEPQSMVDAVGLDRADENTGSVGDESTPGDNAASAEESVGMESNDNTGNTGSIGKAVTKTDNTGKTSDKPGDTAASSGGTTAKPDDSTGNTGEAAAKPGNSTGNTGEAAAKPGDSTGSTEGTTKPEDSTGSEGDTTKPGDNTGSTGGTTKPGDDPGSTGGSTTEPGDNTGNTTNPGDNTGNAQTPDPPEHEHNWQPVYTTVHHDEVGHYETVVVSEAYDEKVYDYKAVCSACGAYYDTVEEVGYHIQDDHDGHGSYSVKKVVIDTIHHDAVMEQRYVVDQSAYDEQVLVEYKCSCGETKKP